MNRYTTTHAERIAELTEQIEIAELEELTALGSANFAEYTKLVAERAERAREIAEIKRTMSQLSYKDENYDFSDALRDEEWANFNKKHDVSKL